jgi:hypothetical protein
VGTHEMLLSMEGEAWDTCAGYRIDAGSETLVGDVLGGMGEELRGGKGRREGSKKSSPSESAFFCPAIHA